MFNKAIKQISNSLSSKNNTGSQADSISDKILNILNFKNNVSINKNQEEINALNILEIEHKRYLSLLYSNGVKTSQEDELSRINDSVFKLNIKDMNRIYNLFRLKLIVDLETRYKISYEEFKIEFDIYLHNLNQELVLKQSLQSRLYYKYDYSDVSHGLFFDLSPLLNLVGFKLPDFKMIKSIINVVRPIEFRRKNYNNEHEFIKKLMVSNFCFLFTSSNFNHGDIIIDINGRVFWYFTLNSYPLELISFVDDFDNLLLLGVTYSQEFGLCSLYDKEIDVIDLNIFLGPFYTE